MARRPDWFSASSTFPTRIGAGGNARRLRDLLHRLRRPSHRRGDLRPLRRSHRPQGDADRDAACAWGWRPSPSPSCRAMIRLASGARSPDRAAGDPGHRRRRRVGRLGAVGDGMVAHARPARAGRRLAAIRRSLRPLPLDARRSWSSATGPATISPPGAGAFRSRCRSSSSASGCGSVSASSRRRCSRISSTPTDREARRSSKFSKSSRRKSSFRPCCGCPSRRRSISSPHSSSPTQSVR